MYVVHGREELDSWLNVRVRIVEHHLDLKHATIVIANYNKFQNFLTHRGQYGRSFFLGFQFGEYIRHFSQRFSTVVTVRHGLSDQGEVPDKRIAVDELNLHAACVVLAIILANLLILALQVA